MQTQTENAPRTAERVFDEAGQTIAEVAAPAVAEAPAAEEIDPVDPGAAPAAQAPAAKFRIGDREFATSEEALTFAQSEISTRELEAQVADAYRQGIRDAVANPTASAPGVTPAAPAAPALNHEELYTKPDEYLAKRDAMVEERVLNKVQQSQSLKAQSDQIWNEFTHRHPEMADFRAEVEQFVGSNLTDVRAIIATKGQPASYDFIAMKLKSRFNAYAEATKPKRELPNTTAGASPSSKAAGVTPPAPEKKPLSFSEQVSNIRRKRRQG